MKIESTKDLAKVIALCRKTGVDLIKIDGIEIHLGAQPEVHVSQAASIMQQPVQTYAPGGITADTRIQTDELTPEQLLYYSVQDNTAN